MYQLKKLKSLLLLLCIAVTAKAQLSDGKVYNFVNVGKGASMSIKAVDGANVVATDQSNYSQLWYAASENGGFTLRNLANGYYLQSPNATSSAWTMVKVKDENCIFTATSVGGNYAIRVTGNSGGYNYMHADGGGNIVCWESSNTNSQWTMNVVDIDAATLNANWNTLSNIDPSPETAATYQTALDNLFSDKACTTLKKSFANENAVKNDADYNVLPSTLQEMVLKVYNDSWAEDNYDANKSDWNADYAKKYRVQLYEPYNEPEAAAKVLRFNAHTNMNNPTGIFANAKTPLYVMVEGEIKDGATLHLASYSGHSQLDGYNDGVELKQGLNIVPIFTDNTNFCINYVVHNFDNSQGTGMPGVIEGRELSEYPDLKIHIEGGYINGYYNKVGDELYGSGDKNADWEYIEVHATQTDVTVLGEYMVLQFPLLDEDTEGNKGLGTYLNDLVDIEDVINSWDNVMMWERLVMGLLSRETIEANAKKSPYSDKDYVFEYTGDDTDNYGSDYSDYYNIHGLAIAENSTYMSGGWKSSNYNCNTMDGVIRDLPTNAGSHWGPGHEIGHQHQQPLNMRGLTEVTNNLFSNVVLWYFGETTSRVNGSEGSLSNVLAAYNTEGSDFFTNNIWAQTHMYYKMFLYYHVLGHNPKFYPRLFEMLRQDPMNIRYEQSGAESLLHFYKKCCYASGEDLTEFFRAYGFFRVMTDRFVGDYSNAVYNQTQAEIDAAIKEIKDLKYDENIAVLFINDATGETIKSHKEGVENLKVYGETTICAEVGSYASFTDSTTPDYTYSVSGTTVSMEGEGGTGFAIFNDKGELIAFSDKKTFTISEECAVALASGKAEVKAVKADNTPVEVADVMDTDNTAAKYAALGELLNAVKAVTDLPDATGTKVGYYRTDLLTDLQAAYETAKTVYDNETVASYNAVYDVLYQEYANVIADDFARIGIIEGNAYRLTNKAYSTRSMAVATEGDDMNEMFGLDTDENADAQKWYLEPSDADGRYYLKNKATSKYPAGASSGAVLSADKEASSKGNKDGAAAYELRNMGGGVWALINGSGLHCSASQNYNIVGWRADAEASQWYITAVEVDQNAECLHELQNLVEKTESLVDEMATVQYKGGVIDMNACTITSNATETGHETKYLTDGNPNTFFHTVWSGSAVGDYHNIVIDLGEGHSLSQFVLNYSTLASGNVDAPESLTVQGSADGSSYTDIASLSALNDALPTTLGKEYTSSTLGSASQSYRYIRLQVKTATGGKLGNYYYFGLAELSLFRMTTLVETIGDKYQNFVAADVLRAACDQVYAAQQTIATGSATSDDIAALQTQYDILLQAHQNANNVEFNAKKQELQTWITTLNGFFGDSECGTVTPVNATSFTLSTSDSNDAYYLTGGPSGPSDGDISNLLEDNVNSYYVSNWNAQTEPPYLQVRLPEGKTLSEFTFTFTSRDGGRAPTPTEIVVSGSNDGANFTTIETFTKENDGFPEAANTDNKNAGKAVTWNSPIITASTAYQYLRFTVTKSERSNGDETDDNGFYHYGISKFGLGTPSGYNITLGANAGGVTEELLLESYNAVATASATLVMATTEEQLQKAIDKLKEQKTALEQAQQLAVKYSVVVVGGNGNGGIVYNSVEYKNDAQFDAAPGLDVSNFEPIVLIGYTDGVITMNGTTITVTYNKEYTVQVVGVDASAGGVKLGETTYNGGATFNMLESEFNIENFNAVSVEGYEADKTFEGSTITVTYKKIYTVQVVGVVGQGGVVFDNNNYTHDQELYALDLVIGNLAAMGVTGYVANVSLEGATITVTYNKIYTVQVVGLDGQGGVQFGDGSYNHGQELNALNLEVGNLTAIVLEGYVADIALGDATITVTYKKIYTVNISGVTDQGGVMLGGVSYTDEVHVLGTLEVNQLSAVEVDGYKAFISVEGATINVVYKMIYHVEVVGADGGVTFEDVNYASDAEVYALSAIEVSQLTAVEVSGYVGTVTLDDRTIRVAYCKLIQDLSELRNYKAYHIRAKSGEGYFAWNSSITDTYVSLRGATDWSKNPNGITSNETVANKYKEVVTLSDKTVAWQIIKEGDSYYLYQPEKKAYVTRNGRNYLFTADKTALDGIRQNSEDYVGTFGIHAGGDYSDGSSYFACIVINESEIAVRNWYYTDHGAILQIIENPYVYALDYAVEVVGNVEGRVEFEDVEYSHGESISATELLTASDLMVKSIGGYEHKIEVNKDNATITITYTAIDKTELINLITNTEALVNSASSHLGSSLNVTQALIDATNERLTTARSVRDDSSVNKEEYDATLAELQEVHLQLQTAIAYATLPVQLTFDANTPVTYKIAIDRSASSVLAYDQNSAMVAVSDFKLGNKAHGWYFMPATDGKVYIMPYYDDNTTFALSTNSFDAGNSKVKGMAVGSDGYTQGWTITNVNMSDANRNAGWYNITCTSNGTDTWYFSNHGGVSNKMGFYNDPDDYGSRFQFEQADFSKSEAYYTLYNYYHGDAKVKSSDFEGNDEMVGYYPIAETEAYKTAYSNAVSVLESLTSTDEEYTNAYDALKTANEALEPNMPEVGKYYVIRSAHTGYAANKLIYATGDNTIRWDLDKTEENPEAVWTFTSEGYLENLNTGCAMNTGSAEAKLGDNPKTMSIKGISTDGQVLITPAGGTPLHADQWGHAVSWGTYEAGSPSAWRIVEVEDMSLVQFALTIGQYRHASLYLNYATKIPAGVKVFVAHTPNGDTGEIIAEELIDATVLPAKTAVIVQGDAATYNFTYTTDEYDGEDEVLLGSNRLGGSAYLKYQQVEKEGNLCCVFGRSGNEVGLYKNYIEYIDANGSTTRTEGEGESATTTDFANTDDGTHFKISANKIYYEYEPSSVSGASAFRFRFKSKEEETTTIDELLMLDDTIIYNLYGQRIAKVVEPGIYIVNGKKMYVTEKMIRDND